MKLLFAQVHAPPEILHGILTSAGPGMEKLFLFFFLHDLAKSENNLDNYFHIQLVW